MATPSDHRRLQRLLRVAFVDAVGLIAVAAPAALTSAVLIDFPAAAAGAVVSLAGLAEFRAQRTLQRGSPRPLPLLGLLQLVVLAAILAYAWHRWHHAGTPAWLRLLPDFSREQLNELLPDPAEQRRLFTLLDQLIAGAIAAAAVLYQGGLACWYALSAGAARRALAAAPALPPRAKSG